MSVGHENVAARNGKKRSIGADQKRSAPKGMVRLFSTFAQVGEIAQRFTYNAGLFANRFNRPYKYKNIEEDFK